MNNICGLYNLGNTCFMNSIIQILFHTEDLRISMKSPGFKNISSKSELLAEWFALINEMENSKESISPDKFLLEFQNFADQEKLVNFTSYGQNDASEFLIILMDYIHENLSREVNMNITGKVQNNKDKLTKICLEKMKEMYSKKYSELLPIFYGLMVTQIRSSENLEIVASTPQPFFIMNLPIPNQKKEPTIEDCLNLYFNSEKVEYKVKDEVKICEKNILINNFPNILIICFNRFNFMNRKQHKTIYFPFENLDMNKFVSGYNTNKEYVYDLYGICNHSGSSLGGHYTSMVKTANDKWYNFNDRIVSEINSNVHNIYSKAYVLFDRKKKQ